MTQDKAQDGKLRELLRLMACLRDPQGGCPWDLQQNFASIAPHTVEEVYEVIDAIERNDLEHLPEELGDLLFQVVFYARLGEEAGLFDFETIAGRIVDKLLQRHPHVFPDATLASFGRRGALAAEDVGSQWEAIKAAEREARQQDASILADVPLALTALLRAAKLQKRAARQGFDWPDADGVLDKLQEETQELQQARAAENSADVAEEYGDLLFTVVNLGRHLGVEAETALRAANRKFERRVRAMETLLQMQGLTLGELDAQQLDACWRQVKGSEKSSGK